VNKVNVTLNQGTLLIAGELSQKTIVKLSKNQFLEWFTEDTLLVNLDKLVKVDTAGLAWLLYLTEIACSHTCQLIFSNIPEKLNKLIALSDVDGFLPTS
jgi:phospholipid transport system transporter-binding protein